MNEDTTERIILLSNPKTQSTYRVTIDESQEDKFIAMCQANNFHMTKTGEHKQLFLTINLDKIIRSDK